MIHIVHHGFKAPTKEAADLRKELEERGVRVLSEVNDGYKHIDLTLPSAKINLEVDGGQHLTDPQQIVSDLARGYYSHKRGYDTMHIPNEMIRSHLKEIAKALAEASKIRKQKLYIHLMMNHKYSEMQWEKEMGLAVSCNQHIGYQENLNPWGSCNLECPSCHEVGFYAPRREPWPPTIPDKITRKYRACKWCGFWQEAWGFVFDVRGGDDYKCVVISHKKCGAESAWNDSKRDMWCEACKDNLEVMIPKDDPAYQKIKEEMDMIHQQIPRIRLS